MKKFIMSVVAATALVSVAPTTVFGFIFGGGNIGGATEYTQLLNNAQLANQYAKQLQQYQVQLESLKSMTQNIGVLSSEDWTKFKSTFSAIKQISDATQGLTYTATNFESKFKNLHKDYQEFLNLKNFNPLDIYNNLSASTRSTINDNLKKLNLTQKDWEDDIVTMNKLRDLSSSQTGQLAAIQATNEIALHQTQTLKKLHQTMMMSVNTQNQYIVAKQTKEDAVKAYNETRRGEFDYERPADGSDKFTY